MTLPIAICRADSPEGERDYVTCLPIETIMQYGLQPEAIVGVLIRPLELNEPITPEAFARNPAFVTFLHSIVARYATESPGFVAEARCQKDGYVYIIDQRSKNPDGSVPPEDIIGVFEVRGGEVVPTSYRASPNHRILSKDGFVQLGPELQARLLEELQALAGRAIDAD